MSETRDPIRSIVHGIWVTARERRTPPQGGLALPRGWGLDWSAWLQPPRRPDRIGITSWARPAADNGGTDGGNRDRDARRDQAASRHHRQRQRPAGHARARGRA